MTSNTFIDPVFANKNCGAHLVLPTSHRDPEISPPYTPPSARISHPLLHTLSQRLHGLSQGALCATECSQAVAPDVLLGRNMEKPEVWRYLKLRIGKCVGNSSTNRHEFVESIGILRFSKRAKWVCILFRFSMEWEPAAWRSQWETKTKSSPSISMEKSGAVILLGLNSLSMIIRVPGCPVLLSNLRRQKQDHLHTLW